jgi:hypothetical protein
MLKKLMVLHLFLGFAYLGAQNKVEYIEKSFENIRFSMPATYEFTDKIPGGAKFGILSPTESPADTFRENINFLVQNIGQDIDISDGLEPMKEQLSKFISEFQLIDGKVVDVPLGKCLRMEYTGIQGQYKLHWIQYITVKNKNMYIVSCTSEKHVFAKFASTFESVLKSFVIE